MKISTNIDNLSNHIGGFNKGDSFLFLSQNQENLDVATLPLLAYFSEQYFNILVVTLREKFFSAQYPNTKINFLNFGDLKKVSFLNQIKKFSSKSKNVLLFIDDLSIAARLGIGDKKLLKLYKDLTIYNNRRKGYLIVTLNYSNLNNKITGLIKDLSSVTLAIIKTNENYFLDIVSLKERFIPSSFFPLKITSRTREAISNVHYSNVSPEQISKQLISDLESSDLFQKTFLNSSFPTFIFEWGGEYIKPNKKMLSFTGLKADEFIIPNLLKSLSNKTKFTILRNLLKLKDKRSLSFSSEIQTKINKCIPVEIVVNHIYGKLYQVTVLDVSEEKKRLQKLEQEIKTFSRYLNSATIPIAIFYENKCIYSNNSFNQYLNKSETEIIGKLELKDIFDRSHYRKVYEQARILKDNETHKFQEVNVKTDSHGNIICDIFLTKLRVGSKQFLQLIFVDITSRIQLIKELNNVNRDYSKIIENSRHAISIYKDGVFIFINNAFLEMFGIKSKEDILGKGKTEIGFIVEDENISKAKKKKGSLSTQKIKYRRKEGEDIFIELFSTSIPHGDSEAILEFYQDITNIINLEVELEQKSKEIEIVDKVIQVSNENITIESLSGNALQKIITLLNWDSGAFYLRQKDNFVVEKNSEFPPDLLELLKNIGSNEGIGGYLCKTLKPHLFYIENYPSYLPHKKTFEKYQYATVGFIPTIHKDAVNGLIILGAYEKVSLTKNSENVLKAIGNHLGNAIHNAMSYSEVSSLVNKYEKLISSIPDAIYFGHPSNLFSFVSSNIESITGYSPKEFQRNKSMILSIAHPDDKKIILARNAELNQITEKNIIEYRILPRGKAEYIWVRDSITVIKNENGYVETVYGILSDITEKKYLEVTVRNTEQFKSGILAGIREGVIVLDKDLNFIDWNDAMEKITGFPRSEILGKNIYDVPNFLGSNLKSYLLQALSGQVVSSDDIQYKIEEKNKEGYIWGKFAPFVDGKGSIVGVVAIISDITRRKKLEEEIKYSEQLQRKVIDTIGDFFVLTDLTGKVLEVNQEFINTLGYKRSEAVGQEFPYPWLLEEEMNKFVIWVSNLRTKNYLHDFDMTWQTKDGNKIAISLNTTLLRNSYGEPIAMLNLARNISDRKKLAKELEERNKLIESINNIIQTANNTTDFERIFRVFTENLQNILTFDKVEISLFEDSQIHVLASLQTATDSYTTDLVEDTESSISKLVKILNKPVLVTDSMEDENLILHNIYEEEFLSILSYPIYSEGEVLGTISFYAEEANRFDEDHISKLKPFIEQMGAIIDRILLFRRVTNDATYIHNLLNSIDKVVFTVDDKFRIREVNKAWYKFLQKLNVKLKNNYVGNLLFDELPKKIFSKEIIEISSEILEAKRNFAKREFEILENEKDVYNYLLTINPMVIETKITGAVFTITDITDLKRTENALKILNKQLIDLNEISTLISSSFDINKIMETALPRITKLLSADYVSVWFTNQENSKELILKTVYDFQQDNIKYYDIKYNFEDWDFSTPIYYSQLYNISDSIEKFIKNSLGYEVTSFVSVPMKSAEKLLGVLQVYYKKEHQFGIQEDQLISMIGNQMGTTIDNALLYSRLQSQLERLNILYDLSQQLTATLDVDQMLEIIFTQLNRIVHFDEMLIKFIDESKFIETTILNVQTINDKKVFIPEAVQPIQITGDSPVWQILNERKNLKIPDRNGNIHYYFPMASKQNIIGILRLKPESNHSYDEAEIPMIENVCSLFAIALEKTKLYEETVQKSVEIQKRNKELDDFTYVVSHDLKEPLISIEGYSQILKEVYQDVIKNEPAEYIESIVKSTKRMKQLIDDLLILSRISRVSESFKAVPLKLVISEVEADLAYSIAMKGIKLIKPENMPVVFGNETQLIMVFRNLISNAIKFSDKPEPIIEIGFDDYDQDYFLCYVKDNGIGIDSKYFDKIFVIFQRLHTREEYEGTGAGLAIVKKVIEAHKGKIWVESKLGDGSTFYFTLQKYKDQES